jgi:hypothetical protein
LTTRVKQLVGLNVATIRSFHQFRQFLLVNFTVAVTNSHPTVFNDLVVHGFDESECFCDEVSSLVCSRRHFIGQGKISLLFE